MKVIREIKMYTSHWKKKYTMINTAGKLFFKLNRFLKIFGTVKTVIPIIAAKPSHQTAGLPSKTIVDVVPLGRFATCSQSGTCVLGLNGLNIKGQLYHGDAKGCVAFKVDW